MMNDMSQTKTVKGVLVKEPRGKFTICDLQDMKITIHNPQEVIIWDSVCEDPKEAQMKK
jgi:hypothetical protein